MMYPFMTLSDETEIVHSDMQFEEIIRSTAHLIIEFSKEGGFENASNL